MNDQVCFKPRPFEAAFLQLGTGYGAFTYIMHRILNNMGFLSSSLDGKDRDSISLELTKSIIDAGTEAYNNLFKCLDDFSQTIDGDTSDAIYKLTNDKFLYDLYTLYKVKRVFPEDEGYKDLVFESYQNNKENFNIRKNKLSGVIEDPTRPNSNMSDDIKKRLKETCGIVLEDNGDIKKIEITKVGETP